MSKRHPGSAGVPPAQTHGSNLHKGWYSRNYLPHCDAPGLIQAITFRLGDALPQDILRRINNQHDEVEKRKHIEEWMDRGFGSCQLGNPECAEIVEQALLFHDGIRYRLLAWCIMPNHVHVVIQVASGVSLPKIVHTWKSWTAKQINRVLGRNGSLWQREYYDRYIRDDDHLAAAIRYVHANPVKAGLVSKPERWRFSSARFSDKMMTHSDQEAGETPALPGQKK